MGADLICFICKGPVRLDPKRKPAAIARILATSTIAQRVFDEYERTATTPEDPVFSDDDRQWILDHDVSTHDVEKYIADEKHAEEIVQALFDMWVGELSCRDKDSRLDPDDSTQRIVVAGDMSWGDTPDGLGYETLTDAARFDILEIFGIR